MTSGGVINASIPVWLGEQRVPGSTGGGGFPPGTPNTAPYYNGSATASLANLSSTTGTLLLRTLAGTVYSTVANAVTDFDADPTGMISSTSQIQGALDAVDSGDFSGVHFPPTQYYTDPVTAPARTGYLILGCGMSNDANVGASVGSMLIMRDGNAGLPILTMDGAAGIRIADMSFCGSASLSTLTGAGSGIEWQNRTGSGIGAGTSSLMRVAFFYCVVGLDIGVTDGSHNDLNCDTYGLAHCAWLDCTTAIRTNQQQNVVFSLDMPVFFRCDVAFDAVAGGCVSVQMLSTSDVGTVFKVTAGGVSNSINVFGGHLDSNGAIRTKLYVAAAADSPCIANFTGITSNPNMLAVASGGAFVTVRAGHTVTLHGMSNMGSANGAIFKIDGGGRVVLFSCAIPATLAYVLDATSTLGTTGSYAVLNCTDEATGLPIPNYGTGITQVDGEVPSGTINSSNVTFTLAHAPNPATSLHLFKNGLRQLLTTDYSLSGLTITYTTAPATSSTHEADYTY